MDREWNLVIDLGTLGLDIEVGGTGAFVTLPEGYLRIPFADKASAQQALSGLEVRIDGPPAILQGVVEHEAEPGRIQAIANQADYGVP